jgi:CheY-like chemotaxis protein
MTYVLVVDDEASLRFLLRLAFESAGYRVSEASDGAAAMAAIEAEKPDLVATDFMMPVMNGGELIARLRANSETAKIPVLLVSSSAGAGRVEGADRFMQKPLDPMDVVREAAALLSRVPT